MLDSLILLSSKLRWSKPLVLLLGIIFTGVFAASILDIGRFESEIYIIPSLVGMLWSVLFFVLINTFPYVPPKPTKDLSFFTRLKIRFQRFIYTILGLAILILTIAVLILSLKMFSIWRSAF